MYYKWFGAILIIGGCGGLGFSMAARKRREERQLQQLGRLLCFLENELQYRLTPLPDLVRSAAREASGVLRVVFLNLARELDWQTMPDACSCMNAALKKSRDLPVSLRKLLLQLGHCLGRFDLEGQIKGIRSVQKECEESLTRLRSDQENRLRSYQTLGLCAGAALAILLV